MKVLQSLITINLFLFLMFGSVLQSFAQGHQIITNSIGMKLVLIPKGTFQMGSPPVGKGSSPTECQHEVKLTQDYYLGAFEVTQAQYKKVMGKNPSYFQDENISEEKPQARGTARKIDYSNHPVEQVSWENAVEFCERLSKLSDENKAGRVYRLPTEAEWEYACRAGSKSAFSFGEKAKPLGDYAWFEGNSNNQTHPVGLKKPNAWGLYDMHGSLWEWCSDWFGDYPKGAAIDPSGPREGLGRIVRGGNFSTRAAWCESAFRMPIPFDSANVIGFRVAMISPSNIPYRSTSGGGREADAFLMGEISRLALTEGLNIPLACRWPGLSRATHYRRARVREAFFGPRLPKRVPRALVPWSGA